MTRLKLSPIFRNMFDFRGYKLCDAIEDEPWDNAVFDLYA